MIRRLQYVESESIREIHQQHFIRYCYYFSNSSKNFIGEEWFCSRFKRIDKKKKEFSEYYSRGAIGLSIREGMK